MKKLIKATLGTVTLVVFAVLLNVQTVSAHHIAENGISVNCVTGTVSVSVVEWTGDVEITNLGTHHVTEVPVSGTDATKTVSTSLVSIGGNGSYTAGRQNNPSDPIPVHFTVACEEQTPTPSPTTTPTSTPSETATPSPTETPIPSPTPTPSSSPSLTPSSTPIPVPFTGGAG